MSFQLKYQFQTSHKEKDLGVIITDKLEVTEKANAMLGMITRPIKYKTVSGLLHSGMASIYVYCKQKDKLISWYTTKGYQDDTELEAYGLP